ncbi:MAG: glycine--tRNA ligase [Nitrososphaerota archaeon]
MVENLYDKLMKLFLNRGFFFPSCEIYSDAPAGFWEYGKLGVLLRNRFIEMWRRELVRRDDMIEIDGSQIMAKQVFIASGHLESFADPVSRCKKCGALHRVDRLIEEKIGIRVPERVRNEEIDELLRKYNVNCPICRGELGKVGRFNMMFQVRVGGAEDEAYLRPETCQSIFVDFHRIYMTMGLKLPFAICQFGKSFRNEISPRQSLMRLREFYQAEIEVFFNPKKANEYEKVKSMADYKLRLMPKGRDVVEMTCREAVETGVISNYFSAYYLALIQHFYEKIGLDRNRLRLRQLDEEEKAFYAIEAWDLEAETSLGWVELVACNYRGDYDLSGHMKVSGKDLMVLDDGEKIVPHVFELSMGVDRSLYTLIEHSYSETQNRRILKLPYFLAPIQVAVFPLVSRDGLPEKALKIYEMIKLDFDSIFDEKGDIGRRYRKMDEIGTPVCVTIDYQTLNDDTVTIRDRDTMAQRRIHVSELKNTLSAILSIS